MTESVRSEVSVDGDRATVTYHDDANGISLRLELPVGPMPEGADDMTVKRELYQRATRLAVQDIAEQFGRAAGELYGHRKMLDQSDLPEA